MTMLARLRALARNLFHRKQVERDLADELDSYVDLAAEEQRVAGASTGNARRQAILALGGVEQVKEGVRQIRMGVRLESAAQDVRYALRALRKSPGFTAAAAVSLTLGIGASTAVFSAVDAVVLRALPFDEHDRLVAVGAYYTDSARPGLRPIAPQDFSIGRRVSACSTDSPSGFPAR